MDRDQTAPIDHGHTVIQHYDRQQKQTSFVVVVALRVNLVKMGSVNTA